MGAKKDKDVMIYEEIMERSNYLEEFLKGNYEYVRREILKQRKMKIKKMGLQIDLNETLLDELILYYEFFDKAVDTLSKGLDNNEALRIILDDREYNALMNLSDMIGSNFIDNCYSKIEHVSKNYYILNNGHITGIIVHDVEIEGLPSEMKEFTNLKYLLLIWDNLNEIPDPIFKIKSLQYLNLSHNSIKEVSESIGELENLLYLKLSYNKIHKLPLSMGNLHKLEYLDISYNPINGIDERIAVGLVNLKILHAEDTEFNLAIFDDNTNLVIYY